MAESSTATSKQPWWKTLYESIVFWSLVAAIFDIVANFFGGSALGPGFVLCMTLASYSSGLREPATGKQFRPTFSRAYLLLLIPWVGLFALKAYSDHTRGKDFAALATAAQVLVAVCCLLASVRRIARLPVRAVADAEPGNPIEQVNGSV